MFNKKLATVITVGALSLTGCSLAPTGVGATGSDASSEGLSAQAAPATTGKATAPALKAAPKPSTKAPAAKAPAVKPELAPASAPKPAVAPAAAPQPPAPKPAAKPAPAKAPVAPQGNAVPAANVAAAPAAGNGKQAATTLGWGPVVAGDEFSYTGAPDSAKWGVYDSAGHAGNGIRSPKAWSVANGVATVTGDSAGTTGGMSAKFARQKYGRWETRMKTNARDPQYHPVLILWPTKPSSTCDEIDYAEGAGNTSKIKFFLHYECGGSNFQTQSSYAVDTTQWHNYAVEWTPAGITGYVDGVKTFTDTNPAHQPSGAMQQTLQLDWFPNGGATAPSQMQVDWVRVYK
ncbi:glycoside hydrolase family 16 protein [Arthrobacter sp. NPDC093139]|uniref:glycoside hydrolase family 16 protein n=1 Tax=Arthrobacter sp. NPDC093139 TaxID=3363945 RepID=UPI0037FE777D